MEESIFQDNFKDFSIGDTDILNTTVSYLLEKERYDEAFNIFSKSSFEPTPLYIKNAVNLLIKKEKYYQALHILKLAEKNNLGIGEFQMLKGNIYYLLEEWESAYDSYKKAHDLNYPGANRKMFRCKAHLCAVNKVVDKDSYINQSKYITDVKKDAYESSNCVTLTFYVKNVKESELEKTVLPNKFTMCINRDIPIKIEMDLPGEVVPEETKVFIDSVKIEVKLAKKIQNIHWEIKKLLT